MIFSENRFPLFRIMRQPLLWAIETRQGPSHGPGFGAKRALNAALCGAIAVYPKLRVAAVSPEKKTSS
jgi:hypothetical protein